MKINLLKKASKIHAVKCNKSSDFLEGFASFQILQLIILKLQNVEDEDLSSAEDEIENWRKSEPEVTENEISQIIS
ncbi:hypothetical protein [Flavobacterium sp. CF136]|uniref:hypothetical protein n=1 Tax=Flavobacterium sp. (strain CF136) TaxID=1144313 RepID=UPI0002718E7F|nr:hypothetical protein [Flavobacterium sp. CF136]EJL60416.1 hypothetical protein PMI10_03841 [Flavobacterium sp. CF136]